MTPFEVGVYQSALAAALLDEHTEHGDAFGFAAYAVERLRSEVAKEGALQIMPVAEGNIVLDLKPDQSGRKFSAGDEVLHAAGKPKGTGQVTDVMWTGSNWNYRVQWKSASGVYLGNLLKPYPVPDGAQ